MLAQADVVDEVDAEDWAERIHFEAFNVRYSAHAKRLYHTAILMPKVARKNLILKSDASMPLFEYDIKSCFECWGTQKEISAKLERRAMLGTPNVGLVRFALFL